MCKEWINKITKRIKCKVYCKMQFLLYTYANPSGIENIRVTWKFNMIRSDKVKTFFKVFKCLKSLKGKKLWRQGHHCEGNSTFPYSHVLDNALNISNSINLQFIFITFHCYHWLDTKQIWNDNVRNKEAKKRKAIISGTQKMWRALASKVLTTAEGWLEHCRPPHSFHKFIFNLSIMTKYTTCSAWYMWILYNYMLSKFTSLKLLLFLCSQSLSNPSL